MGNFSRETFDALKHYVSVRLQQGVPIVDADINEMQDIRSWELRSFLRWFVGDGVPEGNNGFEIVPATTVAGGSTTIDQNNISIKGGNGSAYGAGRILVDGQDVLIESDMKYNEQKLFKDASLATTWSVAPLPPLTTPVSDRTDLVYLDVWTREVNFLEDKTLVDSRINVETCVRLKREWVVRVAEGALTLPSPVPTGHVFYPLARIQRHASVSQIITTGITDLRRTGIRMISEMDMRSILTDAFGSSYPLQPSEPQLSISLREGINELLWGRTPITQQRVVPGTQNTVYGHEFTAIKDAARNDGSIWLFWVSSDCKIWYTHCTPDLQWDPPVRLTTYNSANERGPSLFNDDNRLMVFWTSDRQQVNVRRHLYCNTFTPGAGWQGEITIGEAVATPNYYRDSNSKHDVTIYKDSFGEIWVLYVNKDYRISFCRHVAGGSWGTPQVITDYSNAYGSVREQSPCVLETSPGYLLIVWESRNMNGSDYLPHIWYRVLYKYSDEWHSYSSGSRINGSYETDDENMPVLFRNANNQVWIVWTNDVYESISKTVAYCRQIFQYGAVGGAPVKIAEAPGSGGAAFALQPENSQNQDLLFFLRTFGTFIYKPFTAESLWGSERSLLKQDDSTYQYGMSCCDDGRGGVFVFWQQEKYVNYSAVRNLQYRKIITRI
jgi:hypothetical protein